MLTRRSAIASTIGAMITAPALAKSLGRRKVHGSTDILAVRYSKSTEPDLRLKLRLPDSATPTPFVVFAHGNGTPYDSTDFDGVANELVSRGIAWASIQYQQAPDAIMPVPIQQAWGAIRFLRGEHATYNLLGTSMGVMGSSAGSALMAQVATEYDGAYTGSFGLHPNKSCTVQAGCLVSACVYNPDLTNFSPDAEAYIEAQYGCADLNSCSTTLSCLPQYHLDRSKPPFLVIAGDQDTDIPLIHSQNTVAAMQAANMTASLLVNVGTGHGWVNGELRQTEIGDFFEATL